MNTMSLDMLRRMQADDLRLRQTETKETPPLYLPWAQRVLNPFPLASSGGVAAELAQPWAVSLLQFACSVFVQTANNATNYWTLDLIDTAANVLASLNTSAIAVTTWTRMTGVIGAQPAAANVTLFLRATATLAPGGIFIVPSLALLRTGN